MTGAVASVKEELITGEELLAMGDIGPCELIDGRIVHMHPTGSEHGMIEFNLGSELRRLFGSTSSAGSPGGEVGIYIRRSPDRVRGADIAFVSGRRLQSLPKGFLTVAPDLVVEIMSPEDRWQDVREKLADYFSIGVERVWIVEPQNRKVLVFSSPTDVAEYGEEDTLRGEGILSDFAIGVAELFAE